jgi:hypothetical protein
LLSGVTSADVISEPFPHLVVESVLDESLCDRLVSTFPPLDVLTGGKPYGSNQLVGYYASEALNDPGIAPLWHEMIRLHTSQSFFDELARVFGDHVRASHPSFEERFGRLDRLRAGVRHRDSFDEIDVTLEAQPCMNTPVTGEPSSVRAGHVDNPNKLFVGLLYLRHPGDRSTGGDLELFTYKRRRPRFVGHELPRSELVPVKTIRYAKNTLLVFLNSYKSLHGVTVRSRTSVPRMFLNLGAEVRADLFTIPANRRRLPGFASWATAWSV